MNKNTKVVMVTIAVLVFAVAALAWLNQGNVAERRAMQESGTFLISIDGNKYAVTMDDLEEIGPSVIDANYKTNLMPAVQKKYTGVPLRSIFDHFEVDCYEAKSIVFSAGDGYASVAPLADALNGDSCYIVYKEADKLLGTRESGGDGPYMAIFAKDRFSQRWCKYLLEITVR